MMSDTTADHPALPAQLQGKSVKELLYLVADDDKGYSTLVKSFLLAGGIERIFTDLDQGLRDDADADFRNGAMDICVAFGKHAVPYLIDLLADADEQVRTFACVMLGDCGNRQAVPALIGALSDTDHNVRYSSAEALGKIGDRAALPSLIALLTGDFWVQFSAIAAIGAMRDNRAVPHLLELLDNELLTVAVIDALAEIGDSRALHPLGSILPTLGDDVAVCAVRAMMVIYRSLRESYRYKNTLLDRHRPEHLRKVISPAGLERVRALLRSGAGKEHLEPVILILGWYGDDASAVTMLGMLDDEALRDAVETALSAMGSRVKGLLMSALDSPSETARMIALRTLRSHGSLSSCQEKIAGMLLSTNSELQLEALATARLHPEDCFRPNLLVLVTDGDVAVATRAAEAMTGYPLAGVQEALSAMAASDAVEMRVRCAHLMGYLDLAGELTLLDSLLQDSAPEVREVAVRTLGRQQLDPALPRLSTALHDPSTSVTVAAITALGEFRTPLLVDDLLALLGHPEEVVDFAVIKSLGKMQATGAEKALVAYLERSRPSRRIEYAVLEALGTIAAESAVELIINRYLTADDPDFRRMAVETLGRFKDADSLNAIEAAIKDRHWSVRVAVLHQLGSSGGSKVIPLLMGSIADPDPMVRKHAMLVLGEIRATAAIPALVQQLDDMEMGSHAFTSLFMFGKLALPRLHRLISRSTNPEVRVRVIDLVGKIGDRRSVDPLIEVLDDANPAVRLAAIDSLSCCFDGKLLKKLTGIRKHDVSTDVRERAKLALNTLTMEKYH